MNKNIREIKFRAWDTDLKVMSNPFGLEADVMSFEWTDGSPRAIRSYQPCRHILMQYTGLKDKSGIEIYESDVVQWVDSRRLERGDSDYTFKSTVAWSDQSAWWVVLDSLGEFVDGLNRIDMPEVIGNIYENPELLI